MKRYIVLLTSLLIIAVLSACSSKTSLGLIDKEADIIKDKEKTGSTILQQGEKAGQEVVATSLYLQIYKNELMKVHLVPIGQDKNLVLEYSPFLY
ncbi:hypothetical protein JNUCC23_10385 [Peribacillus sp. JNUCC 23]